MKTAISLFLLLVTSNLFAQETPYGVKFTAYSTDTTIQKCEVKYCETKLYFLNAKEMSRFLHVDPMGEKYPSFSPYHMAMNNPIMFVDPTGMWSASYDTAGNVVSVNYEDGDTYENLYSQLGISSKEFSEKYGVDLSKGISTKSFDITSYVTVNTNYNGGAEGNANCASYVLISTNTELPIAYSVNIGNEVLNIPATESAVIDDNFGSTLQNKYGFSQTVTPQTGDVAVFSAGYNNLPNSSIHTGVYIMKNQAGDPQFISRNGQGAPVSVSTLSGYRSLYQNATPSVNINAINYFRK